MKFRVGDIVCLSGFSKYSKYIININDTSYVYINLFDDIYNNAIILHNSIEWMEDTNELITSIFRKEENE